VKIAFGVLLMLAGCIEDFKTPPAYRDQRYLCDPALAGVLADRIAACKQTRANGGACGGVFSMTGTLQGEPLTVETSLTFSDYEVSSSLSSGPLRRVDGVGQSPYFQFTFELRSVGGTVDQVYTQQRTFQVDPGASTLANDLDDSMVDVAIRLDAAGSDVELPGLDQSGQIVVDYQARDEIRGRFHSAFASSNDVVDGCFDILPIDTRVVQ
jgi:hypothetical protein